MGRGQGDEAVIKCRWIFNLGEIQVQTSTCIPLGAASEERIAQAHLVLCPAHVRSGLDLDTRLRLTQASVG